VNPNALRSPADRGVPALVARYWRLTGRVQGVGFRPFVYRLAARHRLAGWVRNRCGEVEILAQGDEAALAAFGAALLGQAPPLARPRVASSSAATVVALADFRILPSEAGSAADPHRVSGVDVMPGVYVAPDRFCCDDCLSELRDPTDRRYRYPFANCTQCGPRYTLIRRLPYDRANTTMADFALCTQCRREYQDPHDRRYHAEPIACPACGPALEFRAGGVHVPGNEPALAAVVAALTAGKIVAVKGVGGYHLMCDATDAAAVARLRSRKHRAHKPLAVMFADDAALLARDLAAGAMHLAALRDPIRPIVLVPGAREGALAAGIAPGLSEIGVMLPYSPLHHLLLDAVRRPLVATSANVSGEPVLTDAAQVERRLGQVADAFLHHDRPIERPADDPVLRIAAGRPRWLRLGRGCAPLEMELPDAIVRPLLALGGHMKNTIALAFEHRVVISPHVGDLNSPRSLAVFEQSIDDLQRLYGVRAHRVVCDAHPGYGSTRWAARAGCDVVTVWHHHAHASALAGEHPEVARWLIFTWDGVGLGEDGTLWGGEALLGRPGAWRRVARMRPWRLPGGDRAAREPWRSAAALCWETGHTWPGLPADAGLARAAWERNLNCATTTAVGRLFDAAAALTGLNTHSTFEGQGPMLLEAAAQNAAGCTPVVLPVVERGALLECDWAPLVPLLLNQRANVRARAASFHESIALMLAAQVRALRAREPFDAVGLTGGVFQNRLLTERVLALLAQEALAVHVPDALPCNDAALSFGQIVEAAYGASSSAGNVANRDRG
jgi:hydrogenase maturation protein HypF